MKRPAIILPPPERWWHKPKEVPVARPKGAKDEYPRKDRGPKPSEKLALIIAAARRERRLKLKLLQAQRWPPSALQAAVSARLSRHHT